MFAIRAFDPRTLSWWATQRDRIDFDPPYQRRGGIWAKRDKQYLIDTILNGYDIPKLYIADFTYAPSNLNRHNTQYAVIDGKQRFESILDFVDGRITLAKEFVLSEDPSRQLAGLGYRDLKSNHPEIASHFDNYPLTVMSVITDEEGKINELFVRLNRNKTLTGPEIRNAMQGLVPELIRQLAQHDFFVTNVAFSRQRAQDLDIAAKFLLTEFRGQIVETKRVNLDRLVEDALTADADTDALRRAAAQVAAVLGVMQTIFIQHDPLLQTQGPMVPYYWVARHVSKTERPKLRQFLVAFESRREENRRLARAKPGDPGIDQVLLRYDTLNRSINDQKSIEGRYEILIDAFRRATA